MSQWCNLPSCAESFDIFNISGGEGVTKEDLTRLVTACLVENSVRVSVHDIAAIVESTFATFDADRDGVINLVEFQAVVEANPSLLDPITLNVPELILSAREGGVSTRGLRAAP